MKINFSLLIFLFAIAAIWLIFYGFALMDHHNDYGTTYFLGGTILFGSSLIAFTTLKKDK